MLVRPVATPELARKVHELRPFVADPLCARCHHLTGFRPGGFDRLSLGSNAYHFGNIAR